MYIELFDDSNTFGILSIEPNVSEKKISVLVNSYKKTFKNSDPDYRVDGLISFLKSKGYTATEVNPFGVFF